MSKVGYNQGKAKAATSGHIGREFYDRVVEYGDDHIDRNRSPWNMIWTSDKGWYQTATGTDSLKAKEVAIYEEKFSKGMEAQNKAYRAKGNSDKCFKDIEHYYDKHQPHEAILQFAKKKDFWDIVGYDDDGKPIWGNFNEQKFKENGKAVQKMVDKFVRRAEKAGLEVLDVVIHMDESTPHAHVRFIGVAQDSRGFDTLDMTNCLKAHHFTQTTDEGDNKKANPIRQFTDWMRTGLEDYMESEGYEVNRDRIAGASDLKTWQKNVDEAAAEVSAAIKQKRAIKRVPYPADVDDTLDYATEMLKEHARNNRRWGADPKKTSAQKEEYNAKADRLEAEAERLQKLQQTITEQKLIEEKLLKADKDIDNGLNKLIYYTEPVKPSDEDMPS